MTIKSLVSHLTAVHRYGLHITVLSEEDQREFHERDHSNPDRALLFPEHGDELHHFAATGGDGDA